jgi:hypothetical protein
MLLIKNKKMHIKKKQSKNAITTIIKQIPRNSWRISHLASMTQLLGGTFILTAYLRIICNACDAATPSFRLWWLLAWYSIGHC